MRGSMLEHASLFFLLTYTTMCYKLSYCMGKDTSLCHEIERQALLDIKKSAEKDPSTLLYSWNATDQFDCCMWEGVVCSNLTGHVHELRLRGRLGYKTNKELNPSLLNLKHTRLLDLSQNYIGDTIPTFIGSFVSLVYLNLSNSGFRGTIPYHVGNLSNLRTLSIGSWSLEVEGLDWLSHLSRLEHLDMSGVNLSKATNWLQVINTLPSLKELHFQFCSLGIIGPLDHVNLSSLAVLDVSHNHFQNTIIPNWIFQLNELTFLDASKCEFKGPIPSTSNITKLQRIDLSSNSFNTVIPNWIFQLNELTFLDASECDFKGPIPSTSNITKLQYIDLSSNSFNTVIPNWLYLCNHLEYADMSENHFHGTISESIVNLTSLKSLVLLKNELSGKISRKIAGVLMCNSRYLDLSDNNLEGEMSDILGSMSDCETGVMEHLYLWGNQLSGNLPDIFGNFNRLQTLQIAGNSVSGSIPASLGKLSALRDLGLQSNKLTSCLPESFGQLVNLENVDLSNNKLEGVVTESHFSNLTKLNSFLASENHLTLKVRPTWIPPFKLFALTLGSWNLGTNQIPIWLETQKGHIYILDLSHTRLASNRIPSWFWDIAFILNLSHNQLYGSIIHGKNSFPFETLLSSNRFSGPLPRVGGASLLDLSNNSFSGGISQVFCDTPYECNSSLWVLNLEGNKISGQIPDCLMKCASLVYLNLGNNKMSGTIPNSIGLLSKLQSLNLYYNSFSGQIPTSLQNCSGLAKIDLSNNEFVGDVPKWLGTSLPNLRFLILRTNKLIGKLFPELCHLNSLQILDLSDNSFSGTIPHCFNNFTPMTTKGRLANERNVDLKFGFAISGLVDNAFGQAKEFALDVAFILVLDGAFVHAKGNALHYDSTLSLVTNIDLSRNNFTGEIPEELTMLVELRSMNLSWNRLRGSIPKAIGNMTQLESLDFSRNSLSGEIPESISTLTSLSYLNLSFNNLTGRIPESTQLQSLPNSSFIGNNLCGLPLTNRCNNDHEDTPNQEKVDHHHSDSEVDWFYVFLTLGYATGFSVTCITLIFNKTCRYAYFGFLSNTWDKLYVWYKTC